MNRTQTMHYRRATITVLALLNKHQLEETTNMTTTLVACSRCQTRTPWKADPGRAICKHCLLNVIVRESDNQAGRDLISYVRTFEAETFNRTLNIYKSSGTVDKRGRFVPLDVAKLKTLTQ